MDPTEIILRLAEEKRLPARGKETEEGHPEEIVECYSPFFGRFLKVLILLACQ